jgi:hypothetical protein
MNDGPESPDVTVLSEDEVARGWRFSISIKTGKESRSIQLRLDWSDYNLWSQGRLSPAEVAVGVVACAAELLGVDSLPEQVDAATLRRIAPSLEDRLDEYLDR